MAPKTHLARQSAAANAKTAELNGKTEEARESFNSLIIVVVFITNPRSLTIEGEEVKRTSPRRRESIYRYCILYIHI